MKDKTLVLDLFLRKSDGLSFVHNRDTAVFRAILRNQYLFFIRRQRNFTKTVAVAFRRL